MVCAKNRFFQNRMWRKSRSQQAGQRFCFGVEQNRNFDFHHAGLPIFTDFPVRSYYNKIAILLISPKPQRVEHRKTLVRRHLQENNHFPNPKREHWPISSTASITLSYISRFILMDKCCFFLM